ncbi:MAG TPA: hypothetical protein VK603_10845 [Candidatus Saccharimonadales bacterium]|nr:hypothetical protein [Candidatus Saccharimonadales bacterium]
MIDLESGRYAANGCANIIGFAPRKSTVARPRPDEQGSDLTMKPIVAGKPAAQSRTHPDAASVCSAVFCKIHRRDNACSDCGKPGEPQRKF